MTADRWHEMLRHLAGEPMPEPPPRPRPGRRCRPLGEIEDRDPHAEAYDQLNQRTTNHEHRQA